MRTAMMGIFLSSIVMVHAVAVAQEKEDLKPLEFKLLDLGPKPMACCRWPARS